MLGALFVLFGALAPAGAEGSTAPSSERLILHVGMPPATFTEPESFNPLQAELGGLGQWGEVLLPVFDTVVRSAPDGTLLPYILKGVDADDDGTFGEDEYGRMRKGYERLDGRPCTVDNGCQMHVRAFYDFNGVTFHDGAQADVWDLLFSYHLMPLRLTRAYYWNLGLQVDVVATDGSDWSIPLAPGARADLRASLEFTMSSAFGAFYTEALAPTFYPQHVWEKRGQRGDAPAPITATDLHADLGCLIYPPQTSGAYEDTSKAGQRITAGATDLPEGCTMPFDYTGAGCYVIPAQHWAPAAADVIGSGPFRFVTGVPRRSVELERYDRYYVGGNPEDPAHPFDPALRDYLQLPTLQGIRFERMPSQASAALALKGKKIDYYYGGFPGNLADSLIHPHIATVRQPQPSYYYLGYNLRRLPLGYGPSGADTGLLLRQAIAHLIDRDSYALNLLNGHGGPWFAVTNPAERSWTSDAITKPVYDPSLAVDLLDRPEARALGFGPDPVGPCSAGTPEGCRGLPGRGTAPLELKVTPTVYDPARAAAAEMIAAEMRSIGLNAVTVVLDFYSLVSAVDRRDFDLYILGWRLGAGAPDHLYSFFHSSNACCGLNYPGLRDLTVDEAIEDARAEFDPDRSRALYFEAQRLLSELRPYEPLFYRTISQAFREDRFVGWTESPGTIWNLWSLLRIHPPTRAPQIRVHGPLLVVESGVTLAVSVVDDDGQAVPRPIIQVEVTGGAGGTLRSGSVSGTEISGSADDEGSFSFAFLPPPPQDRLVTPWARLTITATGPGGLSSTVTVVLSLSRPRPIMGPADPMPDQEDPILIGPAAPWRCPVDSRWEEQGCVIVTDPRGEAERIIGSLVLVAVALSLISVRIAQLRLRREY